MTIFWNLILWLILCLDQIIRALARIPHLHHIAIFFTSRYLGRRMTLDEFFRHYAKMQEQGWRAKIGWHHCKNMIVLSPFMRPYYELPECRDDSFWCPIHSVLEYILGRRCHHYAMPDIPGETLGLREKDIKALRDATDMTEGHDPKLRQRLLDPFQLFERKPKLVRAA